MLKKKKLLTVETLDRWISWNKLLKVETAELDI